MSKQRTPVYVVNRKGKPLMPTFRFGHVRKLMKEGRAVPISNEPFTIRLKYDTPDITQELYGGVDTGRENIGLAASKEDGAGVYLSDVKTNNKSSRSRWLTVRGSADSADTITVSVSREKPYTMARKCRTAMRIPSARGSRANRRT